MRRPDKPNDWEYWDLKSDLEAMERGGYEEERLEFYRMQLAKVRDYGIKLDGANEVLTNEIVFRNTLLYISVTSSLILSAALCVVLVQWVL